MSCSGVYFQGQVQITYEHLHLSPKINGFKRLNKLTVMNDNNKIAGRFSNSVVHHSLGAVS